ncbi:hypothetical protein [Pseudonocardia acidicola]|uniref:Uncharacterized protein n=1 Tax=Pseudonocardia acidicola TaxID=2724939 RepID=A0ABX1S6Y0_9PSEU|nr:hypothetical protein [Pseudonocardia acidicola]NMH96228.1 hypothetical protein [Pseudonocardia acidicola]
MANRGSRAARHELDRAIVSGVTLLGVAGIVGLSGLAVGIAVALRFFRQWVRHAEVPPTEVVRHRWEQARSAATAGIDAWRDAHAEQRAPSRD